MYNPGDDSELDRLSREAAGKYEPPGNANWQALSKELDNVLPQEKKKRRFLFWWLLPALLAGGAVTYSIVKQDGTSTASTEKNIPATVTDKPKAEPNNTVNASTDKLTDKQERHLQPETSLPVTGQQSGETVKTDLTKAKTGINLLSRIKERKNTPLPDTKEKPAGKKGSNSAETGRILQSIDRGTVDPGSIIERKGLVNGLVPVEKEPVKLTTQPDQPQADIAKIETQPQPTTEEHAKAEKKPVKKDMLPARGKGWSFSLLTGIDKSTVKFKYGYKPGVNIGLMVGYHFNDKWALRTGGIYTQKNYKLAGEDFTAPKGSWVSYYKLDQVEGYCRMWEVPLLVSYTIHNQGKKRVTLSTGLSSYFMTKENYDYYYYFNGAQTSRNASYNSTDTHVLSIAHLSAGFENRISKTMSLQIEPYAKIPLGSVGFGNIRLSSFGLNFSVQYRQPAKK